jgi:hypothetical protein
MLVAPCEAPPVPDNPGTSTTINRGNLDVSTARSPMLTVDNAIQGKHGGNAKRAVDL